jgi:hypothetical protein
LAPMVSFISILFCTLVLSIGIVIAFKFIPFSYLLFGTPKHKRL